MSKEGPDEHAQECPNDADRSRASGASRKHAFIATAKGGEIGVASDVSGTDWRLVASDNGSGKPDGVFAQPKTGLGTGVVKALAKQLDAQVSMCKSRCASLDAQVSMRKW